MTIAVAHSSGLTAEERTSIHRLCHRAYGEDLGSLFAAYADPTHVLGHLGKELVSHAMWVTRWLQPDDGPLLRTAYVEMVATDPHHRNRGFATGVLRHLASRVGDYDLAALSPGETTLYGRLGWILWRGPLFIRSDGGLIPSPDERIMILSLPKTPILHVDSPLSAEWRGGELW
ncbi:MAG TPA: GNAT family N-acetyltransferase [Anaerolineales bacterium]|nr:GNAT family N-acetyltransferase [Anaerolineales bacterium]